MLLHLEFDTCNNRTYTCTHSLLIMNFFLASGDTLSTDNICKQFHGWIHRGDRGSGPPPPLKNHKNIELLCNTGPDPLKNHKATKPAFNVGPSSACQRNAIAAKRHFNDGPFIAVFGSSIPHQLKKNLSNLNPI